MKMLRLSPLLFRRIHKWVGLLLGLQFVLWTISGAMMAVLDQKAVEGGHVHSTPAPLPAAVATLDAVSASLGEAPVIGLTLHSMAGHVVYEAKAPTGTVLIDASTGQRLSIDAALARTIAEGAYDGDGAVRRVSRLIEPTLETRGHDHDPTAWRIDFADEDATTIYIGETTGMILAQRNDTWRLWDIFWMLHSMDYSRRESFNHPLIVTVAFGVFWLAATGFYLLFKSFRRSDSRWMVRS